MYKLWGDERAFIVSAELTLLATILVVGMVVGLVSVRDSVVQELGDVAAAIGHLNQSYSFTGVRGHTSGTTGTVFLDHRDFCDGVAGYQGAWSGGACVNVYGVPATHEGVVCPENTDPCLTDPCLTNPGLTDPGLTDPHLNATL